MQPESLRRRRLPHWDVPDAAYFVTTCLEGSMASSVPSREGNSRHSSGEFVQGGVGGGCNETKAAGDNGHWNMGGQAIRRRWRSRGRCSGNHRSRHVDSPCEPRLARRGVGTILFASWMESYMTEPTGPSAGAISRREFVQDTIRSGALCGAVAGDSFMEAAAPAREPAAAADWPMYRHDPGLTAISPLTGGLAQAPAVAWSIDLGGPHVPGEQVFVRGRARRRPEPVPGPGSRLGRLPGFARHAAVAARRLLQPPWRRRARLCRRRLTRHPAHDRPRGQGGYVHGCRRDR